MEKRLFILIWALLLFHHADGLRHERYEFDGDSLSAAWQHVRQPDHSKYVVRDGRLRLYGDIFELKEARSSTFAGLRQAEDCFTAETHMVFYDGENGDEAGLCVYRSDSCYVQLGLSDYRGEHRLTLHFQLKSHRWVVAEKTVSGLVDDAWMRVVCDGRDYRFYYSLDGQKFLWLETVECSLMSPLLAGTSDAPLVGLFAFTQNNKYQAGYCMADFAYFDYRAPGEP